MARIFIAHNWRMQRLFFILLALEIPLTIALLALFGIADPDTYRTKLWRNGSEQGFNSDPSSILYAYANYRPISVPLVWSKYMTIFNVVISVLSMFIMLLKSIMFVLHTWIPLLSVVVHAALVAVYAVAIRNQSAADMSDPDKPSPGLPWYLSKGCGYATKANYSYCMQARASYALTIVMMVLFVVYTAYSIYSSFPTAAERAERTAERQTDIELKAAWAATDPDAGLTQEEKWERNRQIFLNLPKTPNTPYGRNNAMTPRTTAFSALTGEQGQYQQPQQYQQGPATPGIGPSQPVLEQPMKASEGGKAGKSRGSLPFRRQWEELKADIR